MTENQTQPTLYMFMLCLWNKERFAKLEVKEGHVSFQASSW